MTSVPGHASASSGALPATTLPGGALDEFDDESLTPIPPPTLGAGLEATPPGLREISWSASDHLESAPDSAAAPPGVILRAPRSAPFGVDPAAATDEATRARRIAERDARDAEAARRADAARRASESARHAVGEAGSALRAAAASVLQAGRAKAEVVPDVVSHTMATTRGAVANAASTIRHSPTDLVVFQIGEIRDAGREFVRRHPVACGLLAVAAIYLLVIRGMSGSVCFATRRAYGLSAAAHLTGDVVCTDKFVFAAKAHVKPSGVALRIARPYPPCSDTPGPHFTAFATINTTTMGGEPVRLEGESAIALQLAFDVLRNPRAYGCLV